MDEVQCRKEQLIWSTESEKHRPHIIEPKEWVGWEVSDFVACVSMDQGTVHLYPVTADVQSHQQLEHNGIIRVELTEDHQQARSGTSVCHHVQYCAKHRALVQRSGRVTVKRVEKPAQQIQDARYERVEGHVVEGHYRQYHSCVAYQIRHEQEYVRISHFTALLLMVLLLLHENSDTTPRCYLD